MTIPRISTMVTFRQRRCELALSFVTTESSAAQPDEPRYEGIEVSPERVQKLLEPHLDELREAIDEVREDLGRVQGTKIAKDRAMEAFDETYLLIVRMLVWAFRLAGRRELAAKLPISLRRLSKKRAEAGEPQDP